MNTQAARLFSKIILSDKPVRIKLLGDSITHGYGGTGYAQNGENFVTTFRRNKDGYCWARLMAEHLSKQYGCQVVNNGCSGTFTTFIIEHFDTLVDAKDDLIICTIGTNDRAQYQKDGPQPTRQSHMAKIYSNMQTLADKFQAAGKQVIFVANIPAIWETEEGSFGPNQEFWRPVHMHDIHDLWVKLCCERDLPLIDLYTAMTDYCETRGVALNDLLADGLHPNDRGYEVMFRLLMKELGIALPHKAMKLTRDQ